MNKIIKATIALVMLPGIFTLAGAAMPEHGSISQNPALRWEDAFVSGNGRMGAMLFGDPNNEVFVANHCRLFLPLGNREIVPDLAVNVTRIAADHPGKKLR